MDELTDKVRGDGLSPDKLRTVMQNFRGYLKENDFEEKGEVAETINATTKYDHGYGGTSYRSILKRDVVPYDLKLENDFLEIDLFATMTAQGTWHSGRYHMFANIKQKGGTNSSRNSYRRNKIVKDLKGILGINEAKKHRRVNKAIKGGLIVAAATGFFLEGYRQGKDDGREEEIRMQYEMTQESLDYKQGLKSFR